MFHFNRQTKKMRSVAYSSRPVQHVDSWQPWLSAAAIREAIVAFENYNADLPTRVYIGLIAWFKRSGVCLPC